MTRTTLTDRYVRTVTRHLPDDVGPDVARELRATIGDAVDAKVDEGADPAAAGSAVLSELGDPEVLARTYGGRPAYLIGPGVYPDWVRLMRVLPAVVLPFVLVGSFTARLAATDESWGQILLDSVLLPLSVAVHLAFWVTLTFAIIEWNRPEAERNRPLSRWRPDQLTAEVPWRSVGLGETVASAGFSLALGALVAWQFSGDELLTDVPTVLGERFGWSTSWSVPSALVAAIIVVITLWDGIEAVVKARRAVRAGSGAGAAPGSR